MHTLRVLALCVGFAFAMPSVADPNAEFAGAFTAYREAMEESRYREAAAHAEKSRKLGEEIYADDPKVIATLAYNHGHALAMLGADGQAYEVLKETRKLMRRAYGADSAQVFRVEMSLLDTVPDESAALQLTRVLKQARRHLAQDGEAMAELKLNGGMRVWWHRRAEGLLGEAAETFARLGKTEREARAKFWIGKIHLGYDRYRDVVEAMTPVVEMLPEDDRIALMARANLVEAYEKLGESDRATEHCLAIGKTVPWTGTADYQPLFKRPPTYPRNALVRNTEGWVLVEFGVDEMGFVREPIVIDSKPKGDIGWSLEAAAVVAAKGFRYAPRFVDGEPVAVDGVRNRIVFEIAD
ncbi:MAG: energy transducer TonB [Gammaproteobacteria bacterium]|nr:energy transducer TonB [Gammaproteobacteria bacterium]